MNLIVWLVVGGVIGWIASMILSTDALQGVFFNVVVGSVGAITSGLVSSAMLRRGTIPPGDFSLSGLMVALLGAVVLLAVVSAIRRGSAG